jgi:hypothetical protein
MRTTEVSSPLTPSPNDSTAKPSEEPLKDGRGRPLSPESAAIVRKMLENSRADAQCRARRSR